MGRVKIWASVALLLAIVVAGTWALWNFELRWRPKTITKHQGEIAALLQSSGWVSPHLTGKTLYMVSYGGCAECRRYVAQEFPKLQAKGVDTRVIEIARGDENGRPGSTPIERATVAQLWITRDWALMERWQAAPPESWKAPGIPTAEGDLTRMAVVESGRALVGKLAPLLKDNGLRFAYPTLIWWDDKGQMRGCACEKPQTYRFVRKDLGL